MYYRLTGRLLFSEKFTPDKEKNKHCYVLVELLRESDLNCHGKSCKIRLSFGVHNYAKQWADLTKNAKAEKFVSQLSGLVELGLRS